MSNLRLHLSHRVLTAEIASRCLTPEQLRRDKGVVDYEQVDCSVYDVRDLELQVVQEFRKVFLQDSGYEYSDEELLYQVGVTNRSSDGYNFTNAGMLFFATNPQRVLSASFIRLLRFETDVENIEDRGLPTFDRKFTGSITKQVRDIRSFFRESGFFKLYQTRNQDGGFLEVPEYPLIAVVGIESVDTALPRSDFRMAQ